MNVTSASKVVSSYHVCLRVALLLVAFLLVFDSGILSPVTRTLSQQTQQYLANSVSMHASVSPTELNTLTAALTQRQSELDAREQTLRERELAIGLDDAAPVNNQLSTYILSIILFILLVLIILNYVLDFTRYTPTRSNSKRRAGLYEQPT